MTRDLPRGPALMVLARDILLSDLLPLLPHERRLEALLIANCMAIAGREAEEGDGTAADVVRNLARLYEPEGISADRFAGPPSASPGLARVGTTRDRDAGAEELLRRLARDLRIGAFENSSPREAAARAILWRLTIAKLRLANPRFLAANGFT